MDFTAATTFECAAEQFGECLTTVGHEPSMGIEQATTSYSFQVP
jgi:hypothetical protein